MLPMFQHKENDRRGGTSGKGFLDFATEEHYFDCESTAEELREVKWRSYRDFGLIM